MKKDEMYKLGIAALILYWLWNRNTPVVTATYSFPQTPSTGSTSTSSTTSNGNGDDIFAGTDTGGDPYAEAAV